MCVWEVRGRAGHQAPAALRRPAKDQTKQGWAERDAVGFLQHSMHPTIHTHIPTHSSHRYPGILPGPPTCSRA